MFGGGGVTVLADLDGERLTTAVKYTWKGTGPLGLKLMKRGDTPEDPNGVQVSGFTDAAHPDVIGSGIDKGMVILKINGTYCNLHSYKSVLTRIKTEPRPLKVSFSAPIMLVNGVKAAANKMLKMAADRKAADAKKKEEEGKKAALKHPHVRALKNQIRDLNARLHDMEQVVSLPQHNEIKPHSALTRHGDFAGEAQVRAKGRQQHRAPHAQGPETRGENLFRWHTAQQTLSHPFALRYW